MHATDVQVLFVGVVSDVVYGYVDFVFKISSEGSEKYREVNNNIKRCTKTAKENWIEKQCSETEENLRKNNSKRAYQLVKDLTTVKQGKATTVQGR